MATESGSSVTPSEIKLRSPTTGKRLSPDKRSLTSFPISILGTWYVTHSTLPRWKKARNVSITYKPLSSDANKLDDLITYQSLTGENVKRVAGVDAPVGPGSWHWRGNGWLMIASSRWEILGYGDESGGEGSQWVVTYFAKTLFTPAGIDIYSRRKEGLGVETVQSIRKALGEVEDEVVRKLAGDLFSVKSD
jgi:hypothetical protein